MPDVQSHPDKKQPLKKIALVTGSSRGIGASIAKTLAEDGFDIWLNYNSNTNAALEVQKEIISLGASCTLLQFDVSDNSAVKASIEPLLEHSTPFAIINNAGFAKDGMFGMMSQNDWHDVLNVHLDGFFNVTRLILPHMQRKRQGRIVNIVSVSGQSGTPGQVNYSAAKAGLIGATKALAREVAKRNILVNAVAPGLIATDMIKDMPEDKYTEAIPLGRVGTPEEVAGCVRFLCSSNASYVTGQVLAVNGGLYT